MARFLEYSFKGLNTVIVRFMYELVVFTIL